MYAHRRADDAVVDPRSALSASFLQGAVASLVSPTVFSLQDDDWEDDDWDDESEEESPADKPEESPADKPEESLLDKPRRPQRINPRRPQ